MSQYITVGDLKKLLKGESNDAIVILQKDSEGNGYSPLSKVEPDLQYEADSTWSGYVYDGRLPHSDGARGVACLVLVPVN